MTVGRVEHALAQLWSRQVAWMPGGRSVVREFSTVVMTDCEPGALRGPVLYLIGPTKLSQVDEALEMASSIGRGLAVDLMRGARGDVVEHLQKGGFERIASRRLMTIGSDHDLDLGPRFGPAGPSHLDHIRLVQERAFDMSSAVVAALYPPEIFAESQTEVVVAMSDAKAIATATAHHDNGMVGIFGVACDPSVERQGHGTGVTFAAARRGFDRGADVCWLQADDGVAPFYERLGFESIEVCDVWTSAYV